MKKKKFNAVHTNCYNMKQSFFKKIIIFRCMKKNINTQEFFKKCNSKLWLNILVTNLNTTISKTILNIVLIEWVDHKNTYAVEIIISTCNYRLGFWISNNNVKGNQRAKHFPSIFICSLHQPWEIFISIHKKNPRFRRGREIVQCCLLGKIRTTLSDCKYTAFSLT